MHADRGGRRIFFGHTQCVHTPLDPKPVPTYEVKVKPKFSLFPHFAFAQCGETKYSTAPQCVKPKNDLFICEKIVLSARFYENFGKIAWFE